MRAFAAEKHVLVSISGSGHAHRRKTLYSFAGAR